MRVKFFAMLLCLFGLAAPAAAQPLVLTLTGTLQGFQSTIVCGPASPPSCVASNGGALATSPFERSFSETLVLQSLVQGNNAFSFGFARSTGLFTGTINNNNGVLTGLNLSFVYEDQGVQTGRVGSRFINASATSFNVAAPVPEPGTWALMLLGFLAIGSALRRMPRYSLQPTRA